jgi:two-component system, cell cycle sensor histidine kinase PleC
MFTGKMAMDLGKLVWTVSFLLVLFSSPMLVFDLIGIQRSVEVASGANIWYDGQVAVDLLRLQAAVRNIEPDPSPEVLDEVRLRLDNAFNRINSLPEPGSSAWHTQGLGRESGLIAVRERLNAIDRNLKLLDTDPRAFRAAADRELQSAITEQRKVSLLVLERQNEMVGRMQSQVSIFQIKLLGYGVSFVVLVLSLGWLMRRHMRSEAALRATNEQLMELTDNLVVARDAALRSSQAKSNFLANVSHELRTPLNAILGFSEALASGIFGKLAGRQAEYIGDIHLAGKRLLALINDILDLSKLEAGKMELREELVDLSRVAADAARDLREASRAADVSIELDLAPTLSILGDQLRLRQIIDNLLSNAVKFTPPGGLIGVTVKRQPYGGTVIIVTDTGVGIPANDLARVFQPFEQSDSYLARGNQGTGLGLPLVRQLVERHGGIVRLSSEPGIGTEVVVELPAERTLQTDRVRSSM